MRTIQEIDAEIRDLRNQLLKVHGRPTEIYTRIVGYYRSLKNWNKGKREEYNHRRLFVAGDEIQVASSGNSAKKTPVEMSTTYAALRFMYFFRVSCPNCPAARELISKIDMPGCDVNVDTEEGIAAATQFNIYATPTVVFFDGQSNEVFRASDTSQLKDYLSGGEGNLQQRAQQKAPQEHGIVAQPA